MHSCWKACDRTSRSTADRAPAGFGDCFIRGLNAELTDETLHALVAIKRERGERRTAGALNDVAVSVGDRCGGRRWIPQLIFASQRLGCQESEAKHR